MLDHNKSSVGGVYTVGLVLRAWTGLLFVPLFFQSLLLGFMWSFRLVASRVPDRVALVALSFGSSCVLVTF